MKIAIIGTRGIPDFYRGFEKSAQFIALGLVEAGHEVIVFNSHNHPHQKESWKGINLVPVYDPEFKLGAIGNFIYDYYCYRGLRTQHCDLVLQFGATSSIWSWLVPKDVSLISHIYSLEWKRSRYGIVAANVLQLAQKLAANYSDSIVSDSQDVNEYLKRKHNKQVRFIPQGVESFEPKNQEPLSEYGLVPFDYHMYIGSLEADSCADMILNGVIDSKTEKTFLVVGNCSTRFGRYLQEKHRNHLHIKFLGSIYDADKLNHLRYYSNLYFYGDAADGSTHLLLEAMAANCLVSAYDSLSSRYILGDDAFYFSNVRQVEELLISTKDKTQAYAEWINRNQVKITETYNWNVVLHQYLDHIDGLQNEDQHDLQHSQTYLYSR